MHTRLVVLDDDVEILKEMEAELLKLGYKGKFFSEVDEFENHLDELPHVVITDYYLGSRTGVDVMRKVRDKHPVSTFIITSSRMNNEQLVDIINVGWGCYYINRDEHDFDGFIKELCNKVDQAIASMKIKMEGVEKAKRKNEEIKVNALSILEIIDTRK